MIKQRASAPTTSFHGFKAGSSLYAFGRRNQSAVRTHGPGGIDAPANGVRIVQQKPGMLASFHHPIRISGPQNLQRFFVFESIGVIYATETIASLIIDLNKGTLYPFFESGRATDMAASAAAAALA